MGQYIRFGVAFIGRQILYTLNKKKETVLGGEQQEGELRKWRDIS